jgi:hypothetical protein
MFLMFLSQDHDRVRDLTGRGREAEEVAAGREPLAAGVAGPERDAAATGGEDGVGDQRHGASRDVGEEGVHAGRRGEMLGLTRT